MFKTREDVFMTRIENDEVVHGLRETSLEKIGPYNENIKLVLAPSRLNNNDNRSIPIQQASENGPSKSLNATNSYLSSSSKRGSKRKTSESSTGQGSYNSYGSGSTGSLGSNKRRGMNDYSKLEKMVS
jgi:hypothetical protein